MTITRTALVTGGAGFIGCALARALSPQFDRWVVVDDLHPQVHRDRSRPSALVDGAELVVGDVADPTVWDAVLSEVRPDVVVHLAAETGTAQSLDEASRHARVNVVGTTTMLDAFGRNGVLPERIVLSSSRAVYGEGRWQDPLTGETRYPGQRDHAQLAEGRWDFDGLRALPAVAAENVPAPTSVYGATKLAQEQILGAWAGARGVDLRVLRLQNVYGPGQSLINSYTGIVSLFSQIARAGGSIPVYEDGAITRDFVHVDDVVSAFGAVLAAPPTVSTGPVDVGSGTATTVLDLARTVARLYGAPDPHVTGAFRDGDVRAAACDVTATATAYGWRPLWSLEDGLRSLQDWIEDELASQEGALLTT